MVLAMSYIFNYLGLNTFNYLGLWENEDVFCNWFISSEFFQLRGERRDRVGEGKKEGEREKRRREGEKGKRREIDQDQKDCTLPTTFPTISFLEHLSIVRYSA